MATATAVSNPPAAGGGSAFDGSGSAGKLTLWTDADTFSYSADLGYDDTTNDLTLSVSESGGTAGFSILNTSDTASSAASLTVGVAGTSAGSPEINLNITGGTSWKLYNKNTASDRLTFAAGGTDKFIFDSATSTIFGDNSVAGSYLTFSTATGTKLGYSTGSYVLVLNNALHLNAGADGDWLFVNATNNGNVGLFNVSSFGGGRGVIGMKFNTAPTSNPGANEGFVYIGATGSYTFRGNGGTITAMAPA